MKLKPWLQSVIDNCDDNSERTPGWVALHQLKDLSEYGLYCEVNDGSHKMLAFLSSDALADFEKRRNLDWQNLRGCRMVCKEYNIRSVEDDCFEAYLHITAFDSPGGCGSTEIVDHLQYVSPSDQWKAKCRRIAYEKCDNFTDQDMKSCLEDFLLNDSVDDQIHVMKSANHVEDSWGASPAIYSQDSWGASPMVYIQVASCDSTQGSWGETPLDSQRIQCGQSQSWSQSSETEDGDELIFEKTTKIDESNVTIEKRSANVEKSNENVETPIQLSTPDSTSEGEIERITCTSASLPGCSKWLTPDKANTEMSSSSIHPLQVKERRTLTNSQPQNDAPGCKHNALKKCFICLVRTRSYVPEAVYLAAKRNNFQCSDKCKRR